MCQHAARRLGTPLSAKIVLSGALSHHCGILKPQSLLEGSENLPNLIIREHKPLQRRIGYNKATQLIRNTDLSFLTGLIVVLLLINPLELTLSFKLPC